MKVESKEQLQETVHTITFDNGKKITLIGTAHVSTASVALVEETIESVKPDTVAVELDDQRYTALTTENAWENLDIVEIIRKKQLFYVIGQFILSTYQKRISEKTGSKPGMEFKKAVEKAEEMDARVVCIDRNIGTTLKRAWRLTSLKKKFSLLWALLGDEGDEIDDKSIEELTKSDAIESLIEGFEETLPEMKQVLIDERDRFLLGSLLEKAGTSTVAVVGAGHLPGILRSLDSPPDDREMEEIDLVPPPSLFSKIIPWVIPALVIGLISWGFTRGNYDRALEVMGYWIVINGSLSALGCLLALAHPVTIVAGFIAAPITSLNPTIGAGFVTALVQAMMVRPRIIDLKEIQEKTLSIKQWWSNRVTRIFLVFILSSLGSAIGTFWALPALRKLFQ